MFKISEYLKEETLSSSYLYRGRIVNIRQDRVKISGGQIAFREVVEHPGAAAVLALTEKKEVVLVKQHRQPAGEILLELPAGKLDPGERPLDCAKRELSEETGFSAEIIQEMFMFYPSPGFCDEKIFLFRAEKITNNETATGDPDERVSVVTVPLKETMDMIADGLIKDGKTIIALQFAALQEC